MLSPQEFYSTLNEEQKYTFVLGMSQLSADHKDLMNQYTKVCGKNILLKILLMGSVVVEALAFYTLSNVIKECEELKEQVNTLKHGEEPK